MLPLYEPQTDLAESLLKKPRTLLLDYAHQLSPNPASFPSTVSVDMTIIGNWHSLSKLIHCRKPPCPDVLLIYSGIAVYRYISNLQSKCKWELRATYIQVQPKEWFHIKVLIMMENLTLCCLPFVLDFVQSKIKVENIGPFFIMACNYVQMVVRGENIIYAWSVAYYMP